jgi:centromere/kinetochore protein ZW10
LVTLGRLNDKIDSIHQEIDRILISPRLETREGAIPIISVQEDTIKIYGYHNDLSAARLFSDLRMIMDFLDTHLPTTVMSNLSRILIPSLTNRLISTSLPSSVPPTLNDLPAFEELLKETKRFETGLQRANWTRERLLSDWVDGAPKVWLAKQRESSLDAARRIMIHGMDDIHIVEWSEPPTIITYKEQHRAATGGDGDGDVKDNSAKRTEDVLVSESQPVANQEPARSSGFINDDEDDFGDGWGLDEDLDLDEEPTKDPESERPSDSFIKKEEIGQEEDHEMNWGAWCEDEDVETLSTLQTSSLTAKPSESSIESHQQQATRDMPCSETHAITSIPRSLLALISHVISEALELKSNPLYMRSSVASASSGMMTLPSVVLSIFRALAPLYYSVDIKTNMYIYNDSTFLSSHLPPEINQKDILQVLTFGRRRYSAEMESQRTILRDYLDDAQGFVACTADDIRTRQCDITILSIVSRLNELHEAWKTVLSKSVLFKSIGSLLNTVVTKLVNDIEDLGDISEPESIKLAQYCADIAVLEDLFPGRSLETPPLTAVYCENWLKFRYLAQILESSMVDVMFLVREGCLKDFEVDEVVELVKALFADTDVRTRCIEDIRRESL